MGLILRVSIPYCTLLRSEKNKRSMHGLHMLNSIVVRGHNLWH